MYKSQGQNGCVSKLKLLQSFIPLFLVAICSWSRRRQLVWFQHDVYVAVGMIPRCWNTITGIVSISTRWAACCPSTVWLRCDNVWILWNDQALELCIGCCLRWWIVRIQNLGSVVVCFFLEIFSVHHLLMQTTWLNVVDTCQPVLQKIVL